MKTLFTEGNWCIVQSDWFWEDLQVHHPQLNVNKIYAKHFCSIRVPNQNMVTFLSGDDCRVCKEPMPDSIKTLILLNNGDDKETRYFTRIQT